MEVKKVLNNNVIIADHSEYNEVILTGKGIGFGKKPGDEVKGEGAEKFFVLKDEHEKEQYIKLLDEVDESFIGCMNEAISLLEQRFQHDLNEHIHVALTDHLFFAIRRISQGLPITNPFLHETELAYQEEYKAAREIIRHVESCTGVNIPDGEVGFVTLHIHSALTRRSLKEVNEHTQLVSTLTKVVEDTFQLTLDVTNVNHQRLLRHLHQAIDRIKHEEYGEEPESLKKVLKNEYPLCYNLSWKLMKMMQQALKTPVPESEAVYLTLHLQRLATTEHH